MKSVGKRVDYRDVGAGGHFFQHALLVNARDDAVNPALEIARHIGNGFALAEAGLRMVEEDDLSAHALNADLEGDAGAQGRLLENQRDEFAAQVAVVKLGMRLEFPGELEEVARLRAGPLASRVE